MGNLTWRSRILGPTLLWFYCKNSSPTTAEEERDATSVDLMDDLVAEASRSWTKNHYWLHSMVNGTVVSTDSAGRPSKISSLFNYYVPPNGKMSGVTLTLKAGVPECLYFEDDPKTCRTPSPRVVSDYAHKKYS